MEAQEKEGNGKQGEQGVQGFQGVQGVQGVPGGEGGRKGDKGEPGIQGERGDEGAAAGTGLSYLQIGYLFAIFVGSLLIMGLWVKLNNQVDSNAKSRKALCVLQADFKKRAADTKQFVKENPGGIPGISPKQLLISAQNQLQTAKLLNDQLDC